MPIISWTKNGQAVSSSSKFSFDQYKKRLTVHNPNKADEGDYECHANSRKRTANLTVIGTHFFYFVCFCVVVFFTGVQQIVEFRPFEKYCHVKSMLSHQNGTQRNEMRISPILVISRD